MTLLPCPSCRAHVVVGSTCPHCGARADGSGENRRVGLVRATSAVLLLGLSLGADCGSPPQPLYGASPTDTDDTDDTDDPADTDIP